MAEKCFSSIVNFETFEVILFQKYDITDIG